jgi:hypothetical protein
MVRSLDQNLTGYAFDAQVPGLGLRFIAEIERRFTKPR